MLLGVVYQLLSIVFESARITLVQILIQRKGLRLNPITARPVCWQACLHFVLLQGRSHQVPTVAGTICMAKTETGYTWGQTMYYVAPASCMFLSVPFLALEAPRLAKVGA